MFMIQLSVNTGFYATINTGFIKDYNISMKYKDYAGRLKSLQLEKGIKTQIELSRWLGFSRSVVSEWMRGECIPSMDTAIKLSEKFECNAEWLLRGIGSKAITEQPTLRNTIDVTNLTPEQLLLIKGMLAQFEQTNPVKAENKPLTYPAENVGGGKRA
jgi:transcriptional regulator with XRE-family HTH domain